MRRAAIIGGAILLLLAIGGLALWAALPRLIESQAVSRLTAMGLQPVSLTVRELTPRRLVLDDVWLTPSLRATTVTITFDPLAGRLETVVADGVDVAVDLRQGEVRAGGLERLLSGAQDSDDTPAAISLPMDRLVVGDLTVHVVTEAEDAYVVRGSLTAEDDTGHGVILRGDLHGDTPGISAAGTFDLTLRAPLPWAITGQASLTLDAVDGRLPGLAYGLNGGLHVALRSQGETATADIAADGPLFLQALAPAWHDRLPTTLREALPLPWSLALDSPLSLSATRQGDGPQVRLAGAGTAELASAGGAVVLRADGTVDVRPGPAVTAMAFTTLALEGTGLVLDGSTWTIFASATDLNGVAGAAKARDSRLVLDVEDVAVAGIHTPRAALSLAGPLTWDNQSLRFGLTSGLLDIAGPLTVGAARVTDGLSWPLRAASQAPGLEIAPGPDGGVVLRPHLEVDAPQATVEVGGQRLEATFNSGRVEGVVPLPDGPALRLETTLQDGRISLDDITLTAVDAALAIAPTDTRLTATAAMDRLPGEPDVLPKSARDVRPYRLTAEARTGADRTTPTFTASIDDAAGRRVIGLEGRHDLSMGTGRASLAVPKRRYTVEGLRPADYYAPLAETGTRITGTLGGRGILTWAPGRFSPEVDVLLQDVVLTRGFLELDRVNGIIRLSQFWPPRTPPGQTLAVAAIRAGLPLTDALATFQLTGGGDIALDTITMRLADGTLQAGPATLPLDASAGALTLDVQGMDLGQLVALVDMAGLSATGTLDGAIPLRLEHGNIIVEDGRLEARAPGRIQYLPTEAPAALASGGQSTDLLMQALADFRYKALALTVAGSAAEDMEVALHLEGANPDLYDGYPVEFNLTVSGALRQIITDSLRGYQVPDRIRERIQGFRVGR